MNKKFRVAKNLRLRVTQEGGVRASISRSSGEFELSPEVLELLCLLNMGKNEPKALANALRGRLQSSLQNAPEAEELVYLLEDLRNAGVLVGGGGADGDVQGLEDGFGDAWIQWAMLADAPRTRAYCSAIAQKVTKESVVVDVGAGTGVLAAAALRAGAKHVMAIEETATAKTIEPFLRKMGHYSPQRVSIYHGNSGDAKLPSQVDLVVSELFGNDPFSEGVLPTLVELASRLPKGKAPRFIPESVEVFAELIDLRGGPLVHRVRAWLESVEYSGKKMNRGEKKEDLYESMLGTLRSLLDFESLSFAHALAQGDFTSCSSPLHLGRVDLSPPPALSVSILTGEKRVALSRDASLPMVMLWFRVFLSPKHTLSSRPGAEDACEHWSPILVPLSTPLKTQEKVGIAFSLSETYDRTTLRVTKDNDVIGSRI